MASDRLSMRAQAEVELRRVSGQPIPVIIRFRDESAARGFRISTVDMETVSTKYHFSMIPATALSVGADQVEQLAEREEVEIVWYDEIVHTTLDVSVPHIGATRIWEELGDRGEGVTICIVDTGIDLDHPDFEGRIGLTRDFSGKGSIQDGNGHGTHVASIAAGSGVASQGKYAGVAPAANIMVAKVLSDQGEGSMSDVMAGIEWAVQQGAQVINLSLGSDGSSDGTDALSTLCNTAVDMGAVMAVAAGNGGPRSSTIGSPGAAARVITVGATTDDDEVASFSSRGPTADGRVKPDVVAPGYGIIAARATGTAMGKVIDERYTEASGTSMATPHVTGLCALILNARPEATPAEIKARLMETAVDLGQNANVQGSGRVDGFAAIQHTPELQPTPEPEPEPVPEPSTPPSGCGASLFQLFGLFK